MKKLSKRLIQLTLEEEEENEQTKNIPEDEDKKERDLVKDIQKAHKHYSAEKKTPGGTLTAAG